MTLAMGADRAIHLNDKVFAVADTIGTSRTLALAVAKEGADLVLCGRKTVDSETWQVPPESAAFLGWGQLTNVDRLELAGGGLRARRETDEGFDTYELGLPAVVSVTEGINEGIWPAKRDVEATDTDGRIAVWTAADLVDDVEEDDRRFGQTGSPTRVLAVKDVTPDRHGEIAANSEQAAERILELLAESGGPPPPRGRSPSGSARSPGGATTAGRSSSSSRASRAASRWSSWARAASWRGSSAGERRPDPRQRPGRRRARGGPPRRRARRPRRRRAPGRVPPRDVRRRAPPRRRERAPHVLLIPSTALGRDYGPRVAGELELGMTGDCVDLGIDKAGRLIQYKPAYGGNIVSVIMGATTPQLATVRPGCSRPWSRATTPRPRSWSDSGRASRAAHPPRRARARPRHRRLRARRRRGRASASARASAGRRRSRRSRPTQPGSAPPSAPAATSRTPAGSPRTARSA